MNFISVKGMINVTNAAPSKKPNNEKYISIFLNLDLINSGMSKITINKPWSLVSGNNNDMTNNTHLLSLVVFSLVVIATKNTVRSKNSDSV